MPTPRDERFDRRVDLATIAASGGWSLAVVLCFANGNVRAGYSLLAIGTVIATSIALVRRAGETHLPLLPTETPR